MPARKGDKVPESYLSGEGRSSRGVAAMSKGWRMNSEVRCRNEMTRERSPGHGHFGFKSGSGRG